MKTLMWWTKNLIGALLSLFFLFMGIDLCRAAFHLNQPYQFVLSFFASNLIILISTVLLGVVVARMIVRLRRGQAPPA